MLQDSMSNLRMRWLVYQPAPMLIPCLREVANGHESWQRAFRVGSSRSGQGFTRRPSLSVRFVRAQPLNL